MRGGQNPLYAALPRLTHQVSAILMNPVVSLQQNSNRLGPHHCLHDLKSRPVYRALSAGDSSVSGCGTLHIFLWTVQLSQKKTKTKTHWGKLDTVHYGHAFLFDLCGRNKGGDAMGCTFPISNVILTRRAERFTFDFSEK